MAPNIALSIQGMTCGNCVKHVDGALRGVPGVQDVTVDLATKSAQIRTDGTTSVEALVATVEEEGYSATLTSMT